MTKTSGCCSRCRQRISLLSRSPSKSPGYAKPATRPRRRKPSHNLLQSHWEEGASMDQRSGIGHEHAGELALAPPRQGFSLLRLSVSTRLAIVGAITALLWAFVWLWALR